MQGKLTRTIVSPLLILLYRTIVFRDIILLFIIAEIAIIWVADVSEFTLFTPFIFFSSLLLVSFITIFKRNGAVLRACRTAAMPQPNTVILLNIVQMLLFSPFSMILLSAFTLVYREPLAVTWHLMKYHLLFNLSFNLFYSGMLRPYWSVMLYISCSLITFFITIQFIPFLFLMNLLVYDRIRDSLNLYAYHGGNHGKNFAEDRTS